MEGKKKSVKTEIEKHEAALDNAVLINALKPIF